MLLAVAARGASRAAADRLHSVRGSRLFPSSPSSFPTVPLWAVPDARWMTSAKRGARCTGVDHCHRDQRHSVLATMRPYRTPRCLRDPERLEASGPVAICGRCMSRYRRVDKLPGQRPRADSAAQIQGIGNAAGFTMQVETARRQLRLREIGAPDAKHRRRWRHAVGPATFWVRLPRRRAANRTHGGRIKAETLNVAVDDIFKPWLQRLCRFEFSSTSSTSSAGLIRFMLERRREVPVCGGRYRKTVCAKPDRNMVPLGTLVTRCARRSDHRCSGFTISGQPPRSSGAAGDGFSSGDALYVMEEIAGQNAPAWYGLRMDRHVVSEKQSAIRSSTFSGRSSAGLSVASRVSTKAGSHR